MIHATIYTITHPAKPGDVYIGQTIQSPGRRMIAHRKSARGTQSRVYNWWRARVRETGIEPVMTAVALFETDDPREAKAWLDDEETRRISAARASTGRCLNGTAGGDGCLDPTPEIRARRAASHRGRKNTPETIAKMSAAAKGRPFSALARQRAVETNTGKIATVETRAKMAESRRKWREANPAAEQARIRKSTEARRRQAQARREATCPT